MPSCPGWTVADLVAHIGGAWGWASAVVRSGERSEAPIPADDLGGTALIGWAEGRLEELLQTLENAAPARTVGRWPPPHPCVLVPATSAGDGGPRLGLHGGVGRAVADRRRAGQRWHR